MEGVEIESGERREFVPLDEDWKTLYEYLSEEMKSPRYDWFKTMVWILVNTGMRMGEARILKWKQGKSDTGRKMAKNYVYLSPDYSKITIYYKRSLRTIPVGHIKDIFNISKIVGHSVKEVTEFIYAHHTPKNLEKTISKITEV